MSVDVLVVGAGPAGLAAAVELRRLGVARVVVVEREETGGGIPRHTDHTGFGVRDLHRLLTGPRYARRYVELADRAGVEVRTATTATGWAEPAMLCLTSPGGIDRLRARAVVLATGCRERPRPARLVPGDRPLGIYTTGALQQLVYLQQQAIGERAVVVGAEHVSFSALLTLAHAGVTTVAMVTEHPWHQSYLPYKWLSATRLRVPLLTNHRIVKIIGQRRVNAVVLADVRGGATHRIACDTVVFTGDWIPDHELARGGGLQMDPGTRAPRVDTALRTSARGVFAAGNLIHPVETADIAALSGRHVARSVHAYLASGDWQAPFIPILCASPVQWVSPSAIVAAPPRPPRGHFTWRVSRCLEWAELTVQQGERLLWHHRYRSLTPALPIGASARWLRDVTATGGPVTFAVTGPGAAVDSE